MSKLVDLPEFAATVAGWKVVPGRLSGIVVVVVPVVELIVGAGFLLGLRRRWLARAMVVLLLVFSGVYALQWLLHGDVSCGCFGALARRWGEIESAGVVLSRNALMLGLLGVPWYLGAGGASNNDATRETSQPGSSRAFTLVETILTVVLLGLLVALLMPMLRGLRHAGKSAGTLSNLRQHATVISAYATDHREVWPYLTNPLATQSVIRCRSAGLALTVGYFSGAKFWYVGLADGYYQGAVYSASFRSPFAHTPAVGHYIMPCSFLAAPEYYQAATRRLPPDQLRATRSADVLWPAAKSLVVDSAELEPLAERAQFVYGGFVDGHAVGVLTGDALLGYPKGDGDIPMWYSPDWPATVPMTHTSDGARGRDIR